jgi:poly(3-hydroxybutyrate) depolymerase
VFAAVGIHSGLAYKSAVDVPSAFAAMKDSAAGEAAPRAANDNRPLRHCRKIVFHGSADTIVHPANAERILQDAQRSRFLTRERGEDIAGAGPGVTCTVLRDADGRAAVELWSVEGGGHAWFGGDRRGSYTQSIGVDASCLMVRFFLGE